MVNEMPEIHENISEYKWLGAKYRMVQGEKYLEPIPYVEEEDLAMMVGNPRMADSMKPTQKKRYLFDAARGYLITGAFWHPDIWNALTDVINATPPDIIVMRLQDGKGEKPEAVHMVGEDFEWVSSDGYPSHKFAINVYLSEANKFKDAPWIYAFPDLKIELKEYRKERQIAKLTTMKTGSSWALEVAKQTVEDRISEVLDPSIPPEFDDETALVANFKIKANIKYKGVKTIEDKVNDIMQFFNPDDMEEFNLDFAFIVFANYGKIFVYNTLVENGWYPQNSRVMALTPSPKLNIYDYPDLKNIMENVTFRNPRISARPVLGTSLTKDSIIIDASDKLGPESQDETSRVSSAFATLGTPLKRKVQVLSQLPSQVKFTIYTDSGFERSEVGTSQTAARISLFKSLLAEMLKIQKIKNTELRQRYIIPQEEEIKEEIKIQKEVRFAPIPAPRTKINQKYESEPQPSTSGEDPPTH
jgi:hypothetical protein